MPSRVSISPRRRLRAWDLRAEQRGPALDAPPSAPTRSATWTHAAAAARAVVRDVDDEPVARRAARATSRVLAPRGRRVLDGLGDDQVRGRLDRAAGMRPSRRRRAPRAAAPRRRASRAPGARPASARIAG